eukprot:1146323-Pelagomonas_calceolata.AAC.1
MGVLGLDHQRAIKLARKLLPILLQVPASLLPQGVSCGRNHVCTHVAANFGASGKPWLDTDSGPLDPTLLLALQFLVSYKWFLLFQSPPPLPLFFSLLLRGFASMCWNVPVPGISVQQCGCRSFLYTFKCEKLRRAIENNNTSHDQVLEPGASSDPPDSHQLSLFCSFVVDGTHDSSEPTCLLFLK